MSFYVPHPDCKKIYGPKDFGKPPLLLGFRKSFVLKQDCETEIPLNEILDDDTDLGAPTHWRANRKSLKMYSENAKPLNTRIDRGSMKEIPIDLLKLIREEDYSIVIKKDLFREEKAVDAEVWRGGAFRLQLVNSTSLQTGGGVWGEAPSC